jgi:hypothetical protein
VSALQAEREKIKSQLEEYGVTAVTLSPASVDPPCVLVDRPAVTLNPRVGGCVAVTAEFPIKVVGVAPGTNEQLERMLDIVETVLIALRGATFGDTEPFTRGEAELPAYTLTVSRQVTIYGGND